MTYILQFSIKYAKCKHKTCKDDDVFSLREVWTGLMCFVL